MKRILIVDDDQHIGDMLEEVLVKENYGVLRAYSGTEAMLLLSEVKPDLILLDLMLPGLSGEEVLPKIKDIPVIVISAKVDIDHKVDILLGGAVDYITKPFSVKELLARINVALRNSAARPGDVLTFRELRLDPSVNEVRVEEKPVKLTRTEFAILKLLMRNPNQTLTKSLLLESISEDTPDCTESSLKIYISNIRKKLRSVNSNNYIESVWGIGFKLKE